MLAKKKKKQGLSYLTCLISGLCLTLTHVTDKCVMRFCCIFCSCEERCIKELNCFDVRSLLCVCTSVELVNGRIGLRTRNATYATSSFSMLKPWVTTSWKSYLLFSTFVYFRQVWSCRKLHMQCKGTASGVKIRSVNIVISGQRAINLLAMYSSI